MTNVKNAFERLFIMSIDLNYYLLTKLSDLEESGSNSNDEDTEDLSSFNEHSNFFG